MNGSASLAVMSPAPPDCDQACRGSSVSPTTRNVAASSPPEPSDVTSMLSPTLTWSADAVSAGSAISPAAVGAAPSLIVSEASRGSVGAAIMFWARMRPAWRSSSVTGSRGAVAATRGIALDGAALLRRHLAEDDDVRVTVRSGQRVVPGARDDATRDERRGEEGRADRDGDGGGGESAQAAAHLGERESQHQRTTCWSTERSASRPISTDSGVGLSMSPAMRPSASRTTRSA